MATLIYGKGSSSSNIGYPDYSRGIRMNDSSTIVSGSRRMFVAPSNGLVCIHMAISTSVRIDVDDNKHWVGQASDASQVDIQVLVVAGNKVFYTPYDSNGAWFYPAFSANE